MDRYLASKVPSERALILDKIKYQLSQLVTKYMLENKLSEEQIAIELELNKLLVARFLRGWIEYFALDSLISYAERLHLSLNIGMNTFPEKWKASQVLRISKIIGN